MLKDYNYTGNIMTVLESYDFWLNNSYFSSVKDELESIRDNYDEINDRFYRELDFGTAGIRGVMGAGTNRINTFVVARLSYAISLYIKSQGTEAVSRGVVIGYDSRNNSESFARTAAAVFAGMGIKTYIHGCICPVPVLSYSVRELGTKNGIMITASHNPKQYNGYKVYGEDGAQLSPEDSSVISNIVAMNSDYTKVPGFDYDLLLESGKIQTVKNIIYESYLDTIMKLVEAHPVNTDLKVVYTPIHGAGAEFVPVALRKLGIKHLYTVNEQMEPDGDFPTVPVPNPENPKAYDYALKLAHKVDADIILATDPDSDRTGAYAKNEKGEYEMFNGNCIGELLLDRITQKNLPVNPFAVSTVVSTRLAKKICEARGVEYIDVLTGFKFIGEQIVNKEEKGNGNFIFGFEESYGYLAGSYARDKDAVASCLLLADSAAYYKKKNMTLFDAINSLYSELGAQSEIQYSMEFYGQSGSEKMKNIMEELRSKKGKILDILPVKFRDIKEQTEYIYSESGNSEKKNNKSLPESDVLYYSYTDFWFCLRPSGTEPKIKIYVGAAGSDRLDAFTNAYRYMDSVKKAISSLNAFK